LRKLAFIMLLISSMCVGAVDMTGEPLRLKDGTHLFFSDDGTIRMVDKDGKPITMNDGVEMELEDGTLIMMKNKKVWRHIHRKHK